MLLCVATVATLSSCSKYEKIPGFKTDDGILYYRLDKSNKNGKPVCVNNAIVGEQTLRLDNVVLGSNEGKPDVLLYTDQETINSSFDCLESSFQKGILMLHEGEIATFAFIADTVWKYNPQALQGTFYQQGKGK